MKVTGEGRMKESITRRRQAPSIATIGSTCDLNLKIPGVSREEPGRALGVGGPRAYLHGALSCRRPHLYCCAPQGTGSKWCLPRSA